MTIDQAIAYYGDRRHLAAVLNVSRQAVWAWTEVPPMRQLQLERLTRGALRADDAILDLPRREPAGA